MTSDLDVLRELINENALVRLEGPDYGRVAVLEEAGAPGRIQYSIKIKGIPNDAVVIKTDAFPPPRSIFTCRRGECKRADYVIVASSKKGNFIVYMEMKRGRGKRRDIVDQLKGSECLISYCQAIACGFWNRPNFLGPYERRFVSFTKIGISKSRTRDVRPTWLHDAPDRMCTIGTIRSGGEVNFRRLING